MMQSSRITKNTVRLSTSAAEREGHKAAVCSLEIAAKAMVMSPQITYPQHKKRLRCPALSLRMPMIRVVMVEIIADHATMSAISCVLPPISLNRKTLNSMFSTDQAIWPMKPKRMMVAHVLLDNLVFMISSGYCF